MRGRTPATLLRLFTKFSTDFDRCKDIFILETTSSVLWKPGEFSTWVERVPAGGQRLSHTEEETWPVVLPNSDHKTLAAYFIAIKPNEEVDAHFKAT